MLADVFVEKMIRAADRAGSSLREPKGEKQMQARGQRRGEKGDFYKERRVWPSEWPERGSFVKLMSVSGRK